MEIKMLKIVRIENGKKKVMYNIDCSPKSLFNEKGKYDLKVLKTLIDLDKFYSNNDTEIKFELLDEEDLYLNRINEYLEEREVEVYDIFEVFYLYSKKLLEYPIDNLEIRNNLQTTNKYLKYYHSLNSEIIQNVYKVDKALKEEIKKKITIKK